MELKYYVQRLKNLLKAHYKTRLALCYSVGGTKTFWHPAVILMIAWLYIYTSSPAKAAKELPILYSSFSMHNRTRFQIFVCVYQSDKIYGIMLKYLLQVSFILRHSGQSWIYLVAR